ncbi:unnamed protein product [Litomosoides sigmodontis]|uniref:VWFD domain-containing protein n=1 Tax=Litomosoides sigmodontis TaxID=42156 RepID=A0A3P6SS80_LITSI|nr:unnamed protein product [Litomosoides sigmodontis]
MTCSSKSFTATLIIFSLTFALIEVNCQLAGQGIPCTKEGAEIDLAKVTRGLCHRGYYGVLLSSRHVTVSMAFKQFRTLQNATGAVAEDYFGYFQSGIVSCAWEKCESSGGCPAAGVITSWRIRCVSNCSNGRVLAGFCCTLCLTPIRADDGCIQCDLVLNQWYHCYRFACPVLNCPTSQHTKHPKRCCPECKSRTAVAEGSSVAVWSDSQCLFRGWHYLVHDTFRVDPCSRCTCQPGGIVCRRFVCPIKQCDRSRIFYKPNVCCPFCYRKESPCKRVDINGNEVIVEHGAKWTLDNNCSSCICISGYIKCKRTDCAWRGKCSQSGHLKRVNGSCCRGCELKESSCTIFGDPSYVTFDSFGYSFRGTCSYIFTQECSRNGTDPQFKIIGVNEVRSSLATRRVLIYISLFNGTYFAIHLLPKKVIRERKKIISIPYVRYTDWPEYRAFEDPSNGHIVVSFKLIGLKVIWDGHSFVKIVLTKRHQSKVCGLCGNFNGNPNDDLISRHATSPGYSVPHFAQSWAHDNIACVRDETARYLP